MINSEKLQDHKVNGKSVKLKTYVSEDNQKATKRQLNSVNAVKLLHFTLVNGCVVVVKQLLPDKVIVHFEHMEGFDNWIVICLPGAGFAWAIDWIQEQRYFQFKFISDIVIHTIPGMQQGAVKQPAVGSPLILDYLMVTCFGKISKLAWTPTTMDTTKLCNWNSKFASSVNRLLF